MVAQLRHCRARVIAFHRQVVHACHGLRMGGRGGHCCGTAAQRSERGERAAERPRSRSQLGGQSRVSQGRLGL